MFRAIGFILIVWYLSGLFTQTFLALDNAATESLHAIETAAISAQETFK